MAFVIYLEAAIGFFLLILIYKGTSIVFIWRRSNYVLVFMRFETWRNKYGFLEGVPLVHPGIKRRSIQALRKYIRPLKLTLAYWDAGPESGGDNVLGLECFWTSSQRDPGLSFCYFLVRISPGCLF